MKRLKQWIVKRLGGFTLDEFIEMKMRGEK